MLLISNYLFILLLLFRQNILASNWQGNLNTIKADSEDRYAHQNSFTWYIHTYVAHWCLFIWWVFSKEEIYTSRVKYFVKKGRPYLWVPEKELHNVVEPLLWMCWRFGWYLIFLKRVGFDAFIACEDPHLIWFLHVVCQSMNEYDGYAWKWAFSEDETPYAIEGLVISFEGWSRCM